LEFNRYNQEALFGQNHGELNDEEILANVCSEGDPATTDTTNHDKMDTKTFLSQSFHGSRRHLLSLAQNALCLVSEYGRPTLFITLTCNPYWPEIKSMLIEGQTAYDRADVTCKVFHAKVDIFMHNLRLGKYFGPDHKIIYEIRVIEYQQRGLPHVHIVVQLSNIPHYNTERSMLTCWIDQNINATLPQISESSSDRMKNIHHLIKTHMIHKCFKGEGGCLNEKTGVCERGFSSNAIQESTTLDDHGYPHYRRVNEDDLPVVPHNVNILLDWNGHANVEYSGSSYCIIYLYKYLFKGRKKVTATVKRKNNPRNEIEAYLQGRYMCAMDAMWRTLGYQTYPASIPAVNLVKIIMEDTAEIMLRKNNCPDIVVYLNRPFPLRGLLYNEMFNVYSWSYKLLKYYIRHPELINTEYWDIKIPQLTRNIYIMKKVNPNPSITRIAMSCILAGEIWYLRQIMIRFPIQSWKDAKCVNGIQYKTFQEGAIARGVIEHDTEGVLSFQEMIPFFTPNELRGLFVMLTINGYVTMSIFRNSEYYRKLQEDFLHECSFNQHLADQRLLKDLSYRFKVEDKSSSMYGIPEPFQHISEIDVERSKYNSSHQLQVYNNLCSESPNTYEQQVIFEEVTGAIENGLSGLYFVQGIGGSGKSTLCKKVMAWARSRNKLCLGCASTGLAATVYDNFNTAHSLFKFPVVEDQDRDEDREIRCQLKRDSNRYQPLKAANLIVWDEFPLNYKEVFEAAYRALDGFQNQVVICFGDFRQIAPVVQNGSRLQIVNASIVSSSLWQKYEVRNLTINMRLLGLENDRTDTFIGGIKIHRL